MGFGARKGAALKVGSLADRGCPHFTVYGRVRRSGISGAPVAVAAVKEYLEAAATVRRRTGRSSAIRNRTRRRRWGRAHAGFDLAHRNFYGKKVGIDGRRASGPHSLAPRLGTNALEHGADLG